MYRAAVDGLPQVRFFSLREANALIATLQDQFDRARELRGVLRGVAELGVEVKAADGLVDFRTRLHGRTVLLCWRYGEERITHYHELETGFASRRPLPDDGDFIGDLLH